MLGNKFFVSYFYKTKEGSGFGDAIIEANGVITCSEDIEKIREDLGKIEGAKELAVLNWKKL